MQNLKIQTLWQLCQELKQKRQDMIEKLGYTQNYLDQQQTLMTSELLSLRQQNNELSSDLSQLYSHLEILRQAITQRGENGAESAHFDASAMETDLQDLRDINAALETEIQELRADYASLQQAYNELQSQAGSQPEQNSEQIAQLGEDYAGLEQKLSEVQASLDTKETQVNVLLQTVQVIQREFEALRQNNKHLSGDMENLVGQTDQLIGLVETYRQAALAAVTDAGMQDEAESTAPSSEGEEDDGDSKADVVREAVRKKINTVLRHRFGKLPRKLSSSLKEVSSNTRLDKLFDKALKAETIEEFEASIEI